MIVQTLLNHLDEKVKIVRQKIDSKILIYNYLFIRISRRENLHQKQPKKSRRNFDQKVPHMLKKIIFT